MKQTQSSLITRELDSTKWEQNWALEPDKERNEPEENQVPGLGLGLVLLGVRLSNMGWENRTQPASDFFKAILCFHYECRGYYHVQNSYLFTMSIFSGLKRTERYLVMIIETEEKHRVLGEHPVHPTLTYFPPWRLPVYWHTPRVNATQ